MSDSLYHKMGGAAAVAAIVPAFYSRATRDPALARFFEGADRARLRRHMIHFLTHALGGPAVDDTPVDLGAAHAHLVKDGLDRSHFERTMTHLDDALKSHGVESGLRAEAVGRVRALRGEVLRGASSLPQS